MSGSPTAVERTAIRTGYAALHSASSPNSEVVEQIVFALGAAGLLLSPESAAELEQLRSERASTNAALADVTTAQRAGEFALGGMTRACDSILAERNELRERVAELEAASRPAILDLPPSRVTRRALAQMVTEDPHDSPLHHSYRVARDLPGGVS